MRLSLALAIIVALALPFAAQAGNSSGKTGGGAVQKSGTVQAYGSPTKPVKGGVSPGTINATGGQRATKGPGFVSPQPVGQNHCSGGVLGFYDTCTQ